MAAAKSARRRSRPTWRRITRTVSTQRTDARKGKLAHTAYKVLKETRDYSLLEVDLLTGRKHQIRVHLAGIGHPVVGDQRYGKQHKRAPTASAPCSIDFLQASLQRRAADF